MISPIINAAELIAIQNNHDLIIIDVTNSKNAKEVYLESHLHNAIFLNLNTQLSEIKEDAANGGRHPLPSIQNFCKVLGKVGINQENHLVVYDRNNGANAAARLWWMLRSIGHQKVQVLNGGIQHAIALGYPTQSGEVTLTETNQYNATSWMLPLTDMNEVASVSSRSDWKVIDVRESPRYNGEVEPIDHIAGHIPGAINLPFINNLDDNGLFLQPEILHKKFLAVMPHFDANTTIVHCGSGVTACHTLLAMDYAGLPIPKLYVGSWSEWSRNNNEMITKPE